DAGERAVHDRVRVELALRAELLWRQRIARAALRAHGARAQEDRTALLAFVTFQKGLTLFRNLQKLHCRQWLGSSHRDGPPRCFLMRMDYGEKGSEAYCAGGGAATR